jgi:ATP-binding cassette subfamily B protein
MSASRDAALEAYLDVEERESRQLHGRTVRRIARRIGAEWRLLAAAVALILLGTAATLLEPRLFGLAIDEAIVPKDWELLRKLALGFLALECVRVAAMIGNAYLFEMLGQRVMQGLRLALFTRLQALPVSVYDRNPTGRLVTRVTNDIAAMSEMFSSGFVTMIGNVLYVSGVLGWLVWLDPKLGLISAATLPPLAAASAYFSGRLRVAYRNARSKLSALNAFLAENILGMRVVNLFNRQKLHLARFGHVNEWYADAQVGSVKVFAFFQPTITLAAGGAMALLVWFGGGMTLDGKIQVGVLAAYFTYVLSMFQPMREIADKWNVFLSGVASGERIFSILDWPVEVPDAETRQPARRLEGIRGHIVFENVSFGYRDERWVLRDFNLEILPGQRIGVVGHTGAGKTTLISLLMRFYEPQKGRILLDGRDLRDYDKRALRASIGIVQQDVFLFSGSIRENVTLWRPELSSGAAAAVDGVLADFGGVDRELLERGANLSMGERQILAFARALAADPAIWILDEATANVDSESERRLEAALARASGGKTSILIAHRLATVRDADRILVLHKGVLTESGRHDELMRANGVYARLYRYQSSLEQQPKWAEARPSGE